jgi:hypothetical protein
MSSWNIEALKNLILKIYGESQLELVEQSIDSLGIHQDFAIYHYIEYKAIFDKFKTMWTVTKIWTQDDLEESHVLSIKIAANILACLHNLHAMHDTLGQVIRYTFDLKFKKKDIYLGDIKDGLKDIERYKNLHRLLCELTEHEEFKHLNSLMNQFKHNAIINPYYQKSFVDGFDGIKLPSFRHKGTKYPEKNAEVFLDLIYARESNLLVAIGQEINKLLV